MALPAHSPAHALSSETLLPFPDADFLVFFLFHFVLLIIFKLAAHGIFTAVWESTVVAGRT